MKTYMLWCSRRVEQNSHSHYGSITHYNKDEELVCSGLVEVRCSAFVTRMGCVYM